MYRPCLACVSISVAAFESVQTFVGSKSAASLAQSLSTSPSQATLTPVTSPRLQVLSRCNGASREVATTLHCVHKPILRSRQHKSFSKLTSPDYVFPSSISPPLVLRDPACSFCKRMKSTTFTAPRVASHRLLAHACVLCCVGGAAVRADSEQAARADGVAHGQARRGAHRRGRERCAARNAAQPTLC
eukprot:905246-Pleurochrysis_carterae.AAC.1